MAMSNSMNTSAGVVAQLTNGLGVSLAQVTERVRAGYAWRRAYSRTQHELNMLSDRDLSDMGIVRANIPAIARQAADMAQAAA